MDGDAVLAIADERDIGGRIYMLRGRQVMLDSDLAEGERLMRPRWLVLPSLVKKAGYEIGCDIDINPIAPETAAKMLRAVFRDADDLQI